MTRKILIVGATGNQGKALISSLQSPSSEFELLALTRNVSSPSAAALKVFPNVRVVEGDLDKPESVRKVFESEGGKAGIWGVFVVLAFPGMRADYEPEAKQGIMLADLALENQVSHFIYSSVERGGERDDDRVILDRKVKARIERHIKSLGEKGLGWTILRPSAFFMENLEGSVASITFTVLRSALKPDTKIELVAIEDIGRFGAAVFHNSERCKSKVYTVTGDILTMSEMDAAYYRATGKHHPSLPNLVGRIFSAVTGSVKEVANDYERMNKILLEQETIDAHLKEAREILPDMTSFEAWVRQKHGIQSS